MRTIRRWTFLTATIVIALVGSVWGVSATNCCLTDGANVSGERGPTSSENEGESAMTGQPDDADWTGGVEFYTGPVPPELQMVTGQSTWRGVYEWMIQLEATGVRGLTIGEPDDEHGVIVMGPDPTLPQDVESDNED